MNASRTYRTYMFLARNPEDAALIDAAIGTGKLGYNKLGPNTYLGFFEDFHDTIYQNLKQEIGVRGEIHWISLPHAEITK